MDITFVSSKSVDVGCLVLIVAGVAGSCWYLEEVGILGGPRVTGAGKGGSIYHQNGSRFFMNPCIVLVTA